MVEREKILQALYYELLPGESGADPDDVKEAAYWRGFAEAVEIVKEMLPQEVAS